MASYGTVPTRARSPKHGRHPVGASLTDSHVRGSLTPRYFAAGRAYELSALATVSPPPSVQCPAGWTNDVHGAREQICEHPGTSQDSDGKREIEQGGPHGPSEK